MAVFWLRPWGPICSGLSAAGGFWVVAVSGLRPRVCAKVDPRMADHLPNSERTNLPTQVSVNILAARRRLYPSGFASSGGRASTPQQRQRLAPPWWADPAAKTRTKEDRSTLQMPVHWDRQYLNSDCAGVSDVVSLSLAGRCFHLCQGGVSMSLDPEQVAFTAV